MSQSPMDPSEDATNARNTAFRRANKRQDELVRGGVSLSGNERNCCFLNTGAERFANISSAAGLDHIGDGRAYGLVDWDHDGDLDLWTTNRNSPRVQFLRNNHVGDYHFLTLKLVGNGTTTNRDAIGTRIEVLLVGDQRPLVKSLRAGEGFLSQSSKLLHYGLGLHDQIDRLKVQWPGGDVQHFTGIEVDKTYKIVQGNDQAEVWSRPGDAVPLQASENKAPPRTDLARIPLRFPIPLPTLHYTTFEGQQVSLDKFHGSPTLVNLWASWCQPCLMELTEFRDHADQLRDTGLSVVALSVDAVAEDGSANKDLAESLWQRQQYPFHSGLADDDLVDKLEAVLYYLFDHRRRWAVPSSFLLTSDGRLAAIYIGRIDVDDLISDVNSLQSDEQSWLKSALPFQGRWADEQRYPDMWPFVASLFDKHYTDEAIDFFNRLEQLQAPTDSYYELLVKVGAALRDRGDLTTAADRLKQALESDPESAYVHLQLANVLSRLGHIEDAVHHCREVLQLQPDNIDALVGLGSMLKTKGGLDEALGHLRRAIDLKPDHAEAHRELGRALQRTGQRGEAIKHFQHAVRLNPEDIDAFYALSVALIATGQSEDAVRYFRQAHQVDAESLQVLNGLAWVLATRPEATSRDGAEAVGLAEKAARMTGHEHPQILDTLAAAYAAAGKFEKAVPTAEKAIRLAEKERKKELADEIHARLDKYRRGDRHRESGATH